MIFKFILDWFFHWNHRKSLNPACPRSTFPSAYEPSSSSLSGFVGTLVFEQYQRDGDKIRRSRVTERERARKARSRAEGTEQNDATSAPGATCPGLPSRCFRSPLRSLAPGPCCVLVNWYPVADWLTRIEILAGETPFFIYAAFVLVLTPSSFVRQVYHRYFDNIEDTFNRENKIAVELYLWEEFFFLSVTQYFLVKCFITRFN